MREPLIEIASAAARAGGEILASYWRRLPRESVAEKGRNDFVSRADRESEAAIIAAILAAFPADAILGEEGGRREGSSGREWIIDPLDGTSNFISGFPFWCVSIAVRRRGEIVAGVVWDPLSGELYEAERGAGARRNGERLAVSDRGSVEGAFLATGFPFRAKELIDVYLSIFRELFLKARAIRRAGSAALDLALVASGVFDGFFEFQLSPWDIAAGAILIEEAGGALTDFSGGGSYLESGNVIAGTRGVAEGILAAVRAHYSTITPA